MASGGPVNAGGGPQNWAFMPTGPCIGVTLAATTLTLTLNQFVSTARYAPQVAVYSQGANASNSAAFLAFGSSTVTVASTSGVYIIPAVLKSQHGGSGGSSWGGYEIFSTGKSPQQYCAIGSVGTTTLWITPGEGSR